MAETTVERTIPSSLVFDVDFFHPCALGEDIHQAWKKIQQELPPIFWTPKNGGHWIATRADDIEVMQKDFPRFSNRNSRLPQTERPFPLLPLETDPPEHRDYRLLIAPSFSPRALVEVEDEVRRVAIATIEELLPKGRCEFVMDFAKVLPIVVFLGMMELPVEDRFKLLPLADAMARAQDQEVATAARVKVGEYLNRWVEERTANPGNDPISKIATAKIRGVPLSRAEIFGLCSLVLVGGLDTVASLMSFVAAYLAENPEQRRRLVDQPEIIPQAVEELFRRFGVVNQSRRITQDMELSGAPLREGDHILMPNMLVGLDDKHAEPMVVDFDREGGHHGTFGAGPHKCPGAPLARRELAIFLEEWLKRIPDFEIVPGAKPIMSAGTVNSLNELQLQWATRN